MKTIDFTQPGGFPLTQDQLGYLQSGYKEALEALAGVVDGANVPVLLGGMASSTGGSAYTSIAPGWFYYNGELIEFTGGGYAPFMMGSVALVVITDNATPLNFYDGSVPNVIHNKTATVTVGTSVTDSTHFPLDALIPYTTALGLVGRESSFHNITISIAAASGGLSGFVDYKKNFITNAVHARSSFSINNANNLPVSSTVSYTVLGTLPVGYRPPYRTAFVGWLSGTSTRLIDSSSISYIESFLVFIDNTGRIYADLKRPTSISYAINCEFNILILLDN